MRFLSALMPREARFFALFNPARRVHRAGGRAAAELVGTTSARNVAPPDSSTSARSSASADKDHLRNGVAADSTFITPFDRKTTSTA